MSIINTSCLNKKIKEFHSSIPDSILIDKNIKKQANLLMEGEKEVWTFDDVFITANTRKKSSTVSIMITRDAISNFNQLRCLASMRNDTLEIEIGINSGFAGVNAQIKYCKNKIHTNIYEISDVINPDEIKPSDTIMKQILIINKYKYNIGDSLFGSIYSRIVNSKNVQFIASGLFRAKINEKI